MWPDNYFFTRANKMNEPYRSFTEFYPFYLSQHQDLTCRRLHFIGSFLVLLLFVAALVFANGWLLLFIPLVGYGFAWVGHFVFEHNRPATFQYPLYSLMGDWVMFAQILTGKLKC
ncbi:Predicted membrane protein [Shewanella putrefaciens]|nr:Predicted membrane protein [Shewanella putrefaciens]